MKLKFKKIGWFAGNKSARYEAKVNESVKVQIECMGEKEYYGGGWTFRLLSADGWELEGTTGNMLADFFDNATKKETISHLEYALNDQELVERMILSAKNLDERMKPYLNQK